MKNCPYIVSLRESLGTDTGTIIARLVILPLLTIQTLALAPLPPPPDRRRVLAVPPAATANTLGTRFLAIAFQFPPSAGITTDGLSMTPLGRFSG